MIYDIRPDAGFPRHSEGDSIRLADGRLLVAWTRFQGREDHARAAICGIATPDWGVTWSAPTVLIPPDEARLNVMSVSLLREATSGELLVFYLRKDSTADCQVMVRRCAEGDGLLLGEPVRISSAPGYHVMNNARVVQLADGRLLAPVALTADYAVSRHQIAFCYISEDGGRSWRPGKRAVDLPQSAVGCQEPGLAPLSHDLLMYLRTDLGHVYASRSRDLGKMWTNPRPIMELPAPAAPATMARLPDGGLVAVYNHRPDGAEAGWADRTPLALARSDDEGRTWRRLEDIESDPEHCYAYTSLRLYEQRAVLTYYVWPRKAPAHFDQTTLRIRILPLDALG